MEKKRRNWWIWISAALAVVAIGLLVWALSIQSDLNDTQDQLASTQKKLEATEQNVEQLTSDKAAQSEEADKQTVLTTAALAAGTALYKDLSAELGATQEDLASAKQDVEDANAKAKQAEEDAAAAKKKADQATNETDKAQAQAEQAQAEAEAAQSKASIAGDCAKAFVSSFGVLFEGDDLEAQAKKVKDQLSGIADDCKAALAET
jgi:chromosome segregation ATPase